MMQNQITLRNHLIRLGKKSRVIFDLRFFNSMSINITNICFVTQGILKNRV